MLVSPKLSISAVSSVFGFPVVHEIEKRGFRKRFFETIVSQSVYHTRVSTTRQLSCLELGIDRVEI